MPWYMVHWYIAAVKDKHANHQFLLLLLQLARYNCRTTVRCCILLHRGQDKPMVTAVCVLQTTNVCRCLKIKMVSDFHWPKTYRILVRCLYIN